MVRSSLLRGAGLVEGVRDTVEDLPLVEQQHVGVLLPPGCFGERDKSRWHAGHEVLGAQTEDVEAGQGTVVGSHCGHAPRPGGAAVGIGDLPLLQDAHAARQLPAGN